MELAFRAAIEAEMTGRVITPEEAAQKNVQWYRDVQLQMDWIQFLEDQIKPPPDKSNGRR